MVQPETWKLIGAIVEKIWSAVGPLAGVFVGAYLTGRRQKRDWLGDNKKEEYRELLAAITKGQSLYIQMYAMQSILSGDDQRLILATDANFAEIVRSRLFISEPVKHLDVATRFMNHKRAFHKNRIVELFIADVDNLIDEILAVASKDIAG